MLSILSEEVSIRPEAARLLWLCIWWTICRSLPPLTVYTANSGDDS